MASATISSRVIAPVAKGEVTGSSRDDLEVNDEVEVISGTFAAPVNGVAYNWSLAYVPEGSAAAFSGSDLAQNPGTFIVDQEGPYLVRLVLFVPTLTVGSAPVTAGSTITINGNVLTAVNGARTPGSDDFNGNAGSAPAIAADIAAALNDPLNSFSTFITPTNALGSAAVNLCPVVSGASITATSSTLQIVADNNAFSEQFVRLRALTALGSLKLVAAGERVDTVPVPVDITITGWADEQNFNLLTLLSFVSTTSASGRVVYVDPVSGDFNTIQAAMDYADAQGPTSSTPWVVLVRPALYEEDLTFYPFVHLFGWPGGQSSGLVRIRNATTASHTMVLALAGSEVVLSNLYFEQLSATANPMITVSGAGSVVANKTAFAAEGVANPQGAAVQTTGTTTFEAFDCRFQVNDSASTDSYAVDVDTGTTVRLRNSRLLLRGLRVNENASAYVRDCEIEVTGEYGVLTYGIDTTVEYSYITGATVQSVGVNPNGAGSAADVAFTVRWSRIGDLVFRTAAVVGATSLQIGATEHGSLTFPDGSPGTLAASTPSDTIYYDNTVTGLAAENVQDALDEIYTFAAAVRTLDDAYDGGDPGPTGSGRIIVADAGAVQIVDASSPSDPVPPGNTDGGLDVVGVIRVGAIDKPEITFDPNPFGNGASILMGREIWAPDAPNGSTAVVLGDSSQSPGFRNYNLTVGTLSADAGTTVGRVQVRGGDSLNAAVDAGHVFVQAGQGTKGGGGDAGDLYLVPGSSAGGADGRLLLVRPQDGTPASVTAAGVFVGGVTGQIRFSTDMGAIEVNISATDNHAAVLAKFNATGFVTAAGDPIVLTTASTGATSEVFFLNATAGLDAALGGFASQVMVAGTWPTLIDVSVSASGEITFGGSFANPMVYNSITGKLTVPGLIDPTGMIFDTNTALLPGAGKGVIFVGDGTGGTVLGDFYYRWEGGALQNISSVVGGSTGLTSVEENGTPVAGGPWPTLNFTGAVTVSNGGGGTAIVNIGGGGSGLLQGVEQDVFAASAFSAGGPGAFVSLTATYDTVAALAGMVVLYRNGAADMTNVGAAVPANADEYRIFGNDLQIGADITPTTNTYRIVYPTT
jgi:hypothetical protein